MLSKESFVAMAPALALIRGLADWRATARAHVPLSAILVLSIGLAEAALLLATERASGPDSYGSVFFSPPDLATYAVRAVHNLAILLYAGVGWLVLVPTLGLRRLRLSRGGLTVAAVVCVVAVLCTIPQVLIYSNEGILEGRYEVPATLGVVGVVLVALEMLRRGRAWGLYRLGSSLFALTLVLFGISTWTFASYFAVDSLLLHQLLTEVSVQVPRGAVIGIAADPARQYEPALSMATFLSRFGSDDASIKLLPVAPAQPTNTRAETVLAQNMTASSLMRTPTVSDRGCANMGAMVLLAPESLAEAQLPCLLIGFRREVFSADVLLWGGDAVSLRPRLPGPTSITYVVLLGEASLATQ
jgi:hypothetical protein